ncbi:MAG: hypothetical protein AAF694_27585 [Bacteroidota bacterium]
MLKFLLTFPIFGIILNLSAQNNAVSFQESNPESPAPTLSSEFSLDKYFLQERQKEEAIAEKVLSYRNGDNATRLELLSEIKDLLFEVLDLKIQQKELEITLLDRELNAMQLDSVYSQKQEAIQALKESIHQVEDNLQYRKAHRNAIVLNRLRELGIGE